MIEGEREWRKTEKGGGEDGCDAAKAPKEQGEDGLEPLGGEALSHSQLWKAKDPVRPMIVCREVSGGVAGI